MKITRVTRSGERREALLKDCFPSVPWFALLKRIEGKVAAAMPRRTAMPVPVPVPAKIRR